MEKNSIAIYPEISTEEKTFSKDRKHYSFLIRSVFRKKLENQWYSFTIERRFVNFVDSEISLEKWEAMKSKFLASFHKEAYIFSVISEYEWFNNQRITLNKDKNQIDESQRVQELYYDSNNVFKE